MPENDKKIFEFDEFAFETDGNILFRSGKVVQIEPSSARVLRFFLENSGRIISKDEILDSVWRDVFTTEDVLKRAVSQIRRALGDDAKNSRFIETFHRRGYRFNVHFKDENKPVNIEKEPTSYDPKFDCFVGREREIEFLSAEFRRVLQGAGHPVLIAGDAGIGKTQTAANFVSIAEKSNENVLTLRVRFFDYEAAFLPPYDVFLDLLHEACATIFGSEQELRKTLEKELKINLPDELFNSSTELRTANVDASRAIAPLAESFVRLARIRPLIIIFDDIQWADETSRRIIGFLMRIAENSPLMIVGLARRGETEKIAEWLEKQAAYRSFTTLELLPLSIESYRKIIEEVFQKQIETEKISRFDLEKLHTATGGNPYFLVETLRLLMNENVIIKTFADNRTAWNWGGLKDVPLPETIRMAARSKLVKLSEAARELVENASVLGDSFQIGTLELMNADEADENFDKSLDEAISAQVLTEENVSGADDCQFYHTTLRRAVYMDLSPRRKRRLHARALHAIETNHAKETEKFAAALAAHAESAGEFEKSLTLNLQACRSAVARFDWLEASEIIARAERVAAKIGDAKINSDEKPEFLCLRGEVYTTIGRRSEAEKILVEASEIAIESPLAAKIFLSLGRARILLGKYREAVAPLERSFALAQDSFTKSAAQIQLASAKYGLCEFESSCEILQKIVEEEPPTSYNRAVALGKLGWTRVLQSRYAEGKKLLEEAFDFHKIAGDLRERAVLSMCLNSCEFGLGNHEAAIKYALQARREAEIVGELYNETVALMRVARSRISQGLYEKAEKILLDVFEKQKNLGVPHAFGETIWMLGRTRIRLENYAQAAKDLETSLEMIRKVGDRDDEFRILIDQSALENRLQNFQNALKLSEQAAQIAEEIGISEGIGESLIEKSKSLLALKEIEKAIEAAENAVSILEKSSSGERWRAFYALAKALKAKSANSFEMIEKPLRRAVALLEKMRDEFSENDEMHRARLISAHKKPAADLHELLISQKRNSEAEKLASDWHLQ